MGKKAFFVLIGAFCVVANSVQAEVIPPAEWKSWCEVVEQLSYEQQTELANQLYFGFIAGCQNSLTYRATNKDIISSFLKDSSSSDEEDSSGVSSEASSIANSDEEDSSIIVSPTSPRILRVRKKYAQSPISNLTKDLKLLEAFRKKLKVKRPKKYKNRTLMHALDEGQPLPEPEHLELLSANIN